MIPLDTIFTLYEPAGRMAPRERYLTLGGCAWVSVRPAWPLHKPAQSGHRYCVDTPTRCARHVPLNEAIRVLGEGSA